jgi:integrase
MPGSPASAESQQFCESVAGIVQNSQQFCKVTPSLTRNSRKPYVTNLLKGWAATLKKAGVPYFALYELRHTFATRLSVGGVADHMVTQMLRQGDAEVFKLYSQAKLGMMREALTKLDWAANERASNFRTAQLN